MIIYLAAAYERADEMRGVRDALEASGHLVTSRWINHHDGEVPAAIGSDALNASPEAHYRYALTDLEDLREADTMISFTGGGRGGRHAEFGAALILGKRLILVGQREHVFHTLPQVEHYPDWARLMLSLNSTTLPRDLKPGDRVRLHAEGSFETGEWS
jgi:hypothetical protein